MQFPITELRVHKTLRKKDQLDPDALLGPAPDCISYAAPVLADVQAELVGAEVLVAGDVKTEVQCICSRCLINFPFSVRASFRQSVMATEEPVDASPFIKESVLFELPVKALCRDSCLGLCPTCGVNRNETPCSCEKNKIQPQWNALKNFPLH